MTIEGTARIGYANIEKEQEGDSQKPPSQAVFGRYGHV